MGKIELLIEKVTTGELGSSNAVFLALLTENKNILILKRRQGNYGMPGGMVDPGEDLITALIRESMEEINYKLNLGDLIPVCSHKIVNYEKELYTQLYLKMITENELNLIIKDMDKAEHYKVEIVDAVKLSLKDIPLFIEKEMLASSVKEELEELYSRFL
jgi:8-oxo-dGTP pyrophosphatase MutT (NUDIX family)